MSHPCSGGENNQKGGTIHFSSSSEMKKSEGGAPLNQAFLGGKTYKKGEGGKKLQQPAKKTNASDRERISKKGFVSVSLPESAQKKKKKRQ